MRLSILFFSVALLFGQSIDLMGIKAVGAEDVEAATVRELFRVELSAQGYDVTEADPECFEAKCVEEAKGQSEYAFFGSLTKLDEKYLLSGFLYRYGEGITHSDKMTSQTFSDMDKVIERFVKGVKEGKPGDETIDKTSVTMAETQEPLRRKNFYTAGIRIGYTFPFSGSYGDKRMMTVESIALYEMQHFIIEGTFAYAGSDRAVTMGADVGLIYAFNMTDFSPYVAGGMGIHWIIDIEIPDPHYDYDYSYASGNGFALNFGGGLLGFQTYDFRAMLDLRYSVVFAQTDDTYYDSDDQIEIGTQHAIKLTAGISRKLNPGESRNCCNIW